MKFKNQLFTLACTVLTLTSAHAIDDVEAVILAAGKSSRFNSEQSKMLARIQDKPLIIHALQPLEALHIPSILVLGHQRELVRKAVEDAHIANVQYVYQNEQLGTGHAVLCAQQAWSKDHILITYGDMPMINTTIITQLYEKHINQTAALTLIVAPNTDSACAYGRIVQQGTDIRIIEKKHFTLNINEYPLVNAGIYLVKREVLEMCLKEVTPNAVTKEYYFTDILEIANKKNLRIATLEVPFDTVRGINTQEEFQAIKAMMEGR